MVIKLNLNEEWIKRIDEIIAAFLPEEEGFPKPLYEAMNYSMKTGGKRIRPILLQETFKLFSAENDEVCHAMMAAIEMIHTYSLVHDDLPAMDNDEYRRGQKTTHIVYGEAMAILAGDGLLNLAYETAIKVLNTADTVMLTRGVKALKILAEKAGCKGMIGGQTADILAEDGLLEPSDELLYFIHGHKTAALIQSAMMIGGILAGADDENIAKLAKAAYNIGVAFQLQDDILDVTGNFQDLGKPIGSDAENHKLTGVIMKGLAEAHKEVSALSIEAIEILNSFPRQNEFLVKLVESLICRKK
ncbi:MAG: polyprenyl synthetase family protein [Lachnospiraceae bacterium]|nr:polyprenyl synthetase family protein [Lachnospiraceae bacterium]